MPIDASIFQNLLRPPKSIAEYDAEAQASQANALNVQLGRQKVQRGQFEADQAQRAQAEQAALRQLVSGFGADRKANYQTLVGAGQLGAAQQYEEQNAKTAKEEAAADKDRTQAKGYTLEQKIKAAEFHAQQVGTLADRLEAAQWMASGKRDGVFDDEQLARGMAALRAMQNPQQFEEWKARARAGGVSATEQLKAEFEAKKQAEEMRHKTATLAETARGHNLTYSATTRGQNMTDARSRESNAVALSKPFEVTGPEGTPMLVQQTKDGKIVPVQGFAPKAGKDSGLTEGQSKALSFGMRMEDARKVIDGLEKDGVTNRGAVKAAAETTGRVLGLGTDGMGGTLADVAGTLTNFTQSTGQRRYEGAKRNWIAATLRKESGAAIGAGEYRDADNQYFPQPNDDEQTIKDKARRRLIAEQTMLTEVPASKRNAAPKATTPPTAADDEWGMPAGKTVKRTGTSNGRKVVEYSDGSIKYAD